MKTLTILSLFILSGIAANSQSFRGLDKSPADIAYMPDNFAHDRKPGEKVIAKVVYGRPLKKDRVIFGELVPYDKIWRTGANENTEITFYQDVIFGGAELPAGTYSLFTIPGKSTWTVILNSDLNYWGAYSYNEDNDVLRVQVSSSESLESIEAFTIQFEKKDETSASMKIAWDTSLLEVPIEY
jgi:hypothetical protein